MNRTRLFFWFAFFGRAKKMNDKADKISKGYIQRRQCDTQSIHTLSKPVAGLSPLKAENQTRSSGPEQYRHRDQAAREAQQAVPFSFGPPLRVPE